NDRLTGGPGNDSLAGGAGTDVVIEIADVNFTLAATRLIGPGSDALSGIEQALLTGGAGNNVFTVSGWAGTATLAGGGGQDTVVSANDANFVLSDIRLTRSTG